MAGSHVVFLTRPKAVADVIDRAARGDRNAGELIESARAGHPEEPVPGLRSLATFRGVGGRPIVESGVPIPRAPRRRDDARLRQNNRRPRGSLELRLRPEC